jgi:hypothetical protein
MLKVKIKQILKEDAGTAGAPTNSVGSGQIAGVGVGNQGEPPGPRLMRKRVILRRKIFRFTV